MTTWRSVLAETVPLVGEVDARRLVEQASGYDGAEVVLHLDETPTQRSMAYFDAMLARRRAGEPLQYVLGRWGFRQLDLLVDRRALIPRSETEEVAGAAIAEARRIGARRVADLGTGCGAIALSMATELPGVEVWASDVSADAVEVARANLAGIGRDATRVRLLVGSWFEPFPDDVRFDVVAANPPYVQDTAQLSAVVANWEPAVALYGGPDGTTQPFAVIDAAPRWLNRPGALVMEHAAWMGEQMVERALAAGFDQAEFFHDLSGRERWTVARLH